MTVVSRFNIYILVDAMENRRVSQLVETLGRGPHASECLSGLSTIGRALMFGKSSLLEQVPRLPAPLKDRRKLFGLILRAQRSFGESVQRHTHRKLDNFVAFRVPGKRADILRMKTGSIVWLVLTHNAHLRRNTILPILARAGVSISRMDQTEPIEKALADHFESSALRTLFERAIA